MDEGLDTGGVLMRQALPIAANDTTATLHDKLAALGADLVVHTLAQWPQLTAMPQPAQGVTYAAKILKDEALIDWQLSAQHLSQRIRAFDPFPGALTSLQSKPLKVWSAQALPHTPVPSPGAPTGLSATTTHTPALPGTVLQASGDVLSVATGQGALQLLQLQLPGGKRISAAEFMHSHPQLLGAVLG
jgi:methionyl-tRNA formyltransferase